MRHIPFSYFLPFLFLLPGVPAAHAQILGPLSPYAGYFEKQSAVYQQWLTQTGLNATLKVQETEVRGDSTVILYLGFHTENVDTVSARWEQLKMDYSRFNNGSSIENALFDQMTWYFDVLPSRAQVRLYNTYNFDSTACFIVKILSSEGIVKVLHSGCRNEVRTVSVRASDLNNSKKGSVASFKKKNTQSVVFSRLTPYLRARYERTTCENRQPRFVLYPGEAELHFGAADLCKEVLTDESNPWWCEVLKSWACESCKNCLKRERLDVHIRYTETKDGFDLTIDLNAAYGSGFYDNPGDNGYHDLQLDYPSYLKQYADRLKADIFTFLTQP